MAVKVRLAGRPQELKPVITMLMGVAQLLQGIEVDGGTRKREHVVKRKKRPELTLYFFEKASEANPEYRPLKGEISCRLMDKTSTSLTKDDVKRLAQQVKSKFGGKTPFVWYKGKELCSYTDWDMGYQLQLLTINKAEGKRITEQFLDIRKHSPDWEFFELHTNEQAAKRYPTTPPKVMILGESVRTPRQRPIAKLHFRYAKLHLWELRRSINLYHVNGGLPDLVLV
jgi:hypothetical protein